MSTLPDDPHSPNSDDEAPRRRPTPRPGALVCWSEGAPRCVPLPLGRGGLEVGRDLLRDHGLPDARVSARHVRIERGRDGFSVIDLGSTNGTLVDGAPGDEQPRGVEPRLVRIGGTLLLLLDDVGPMERAPVAAGGGVVLGPRMQAAKSRVERLATAAQHVLLTGESGVGKELMARAFHAAARRASGPFVAVNCAAVPRELAERLLFGARRGAFSGAVDAEGYLAAASGGTLFLDEVGELDPALQAKLLRAIEHHEVTPLGATRPTPIDLRLCAATLRDLRRDVARGQFRSDLYFRIGRPEVRLPPLRDRPEEIPFLVEQAVRQVPGAAALSIGVGFVEACLMRRWPGNVRELFFEVRAAAIHAVAEGHRLGAADLDDEAGRDQLDEATAQADPEALAAVVVSEKGNLSRAAARLGLPRSTLRRLLVRHGIDVAGIRGDDR